MSMQPGTGQIDAHRLQPTHASSMTWTFVRPSSLRMARENARTLREILPTESWELLNQFFADFTRDLPTGTVEIATSLAKDPAAVDHFEQAYVPRIAALLRKKGATADAVDE